MHVCCYLLLLAYLHSLGDDTCTVSQWYDTHTHTHLTAVFLGLPGCSGTRKVKQIWILLKRKTVSGSGIIWAICKSAPPSRQIIMPAPHHSVFTGRMPYLPPNQQLQSTEGFTDITSTCQVVDMPSHWQVNSPIVMAASRINDTSFHSQDFGDLTSFLASWLTGELACQWLGMLAICPVPATVPRSRPPRSGLRVPWGQQRYSYHVSTHRQTTLAGWKHRKADELPHIGPCCLCKSFFFLMGVSGWMFLLVLDHLGSPAQRAVRRLCYYKHAVNLCCRRASLRAKKKQRRREQR